MNDVAQIVERQAIWKAEELVASEQGHALINGLIAKWQLEGFVAGAADIAEANANLWSHHHKAGYAAAKALKGKVS